MGTKIQQLGTKVVRAAKWTTAASISMGILQVLQLLLLGRFLNPEQMGHFAIIHILYGIGIIFSDGGVGNALIHRKQISRFDREMLYAYSCIWGFSTGMVFLGLAPVFALLYEAPELINGIRSIAFCCLVLPFGSQPLMLLQRKLKFGPLIVAEIIAKSCALFVIIIGGIKGYGFLSAVLSLVVDTLLRTILYLVLGIRHFPLGLKISFSGIGYYAIFGLYQIGEKITNFLSERSDQLIVGLLVSPETLGYYSLASNIIVQPMARINPIITRIGLPVLSRLQDKKVKLKKVYFSIIHLTAIISLPFLAGVVVVANPVIPLLFGEQWLPVVPFIRLLAIAAVIKILSNPSGMLLIATGNVRRVLFLTIAVFIIQTPLLFIGTMHFGGIGAAVFQIVIQFVFIPIEYAAIYKYLFGPCIRDWVRALWFPLVSVVAMVCVTWLYTIYIIKQESLMVTSISSIALGCFFYGALIFVFRRTYYKNMYHSIVSFTE